jgi:hypothetical protein
MCGTCRMLLLPLMCLSSKLIKVSFCGAAHVYNLTIFSVSHIFYLLHEFSTLSSNVSLLLLLWIWRTLQMYSNISASFKLEIYWILLFLSSSAHPLTFFEVHVSILVSRYIGSLPAYTTSSKWLNLCPPGREKATSTSFLYAHSEIWTPTSV